LDGKSSITTWGRNMHLSKDTLRAKKLQSGDVGYMKMKVADMHNTKHTITMLVDKFLHLQGEMEKARNERIELQRTIANNNKSSRPIVQTQGSTGDRVTEAFGKFDEATVTSEGVAKKTRVDLDTEVRFLVRLLFYFPSRISTRMLSISSGQVFFDRFIKVLVFVLLGGRNCFLL